MSRRNAPVKQDWIAQSNGLIIRIDDSQAAPFKEAIRKSFPNLMVRDFK